MGAMDISAGTVATSGISSGGAESRTKWTDRGTGRGSNSGGSVSKSETSCRPATFPPAWSSTESTAPISGAWADGNESSASIPSGVSRGSTKGISDSPCTSAKLDSAKSNSRLELESELPRKWARRLRKFSTRWVSSARQAGPVPWTGVLGDAAGPGRPEGLGLLAAGSSPRSGMRADACGGRERDVGGSAPRSAGGESAENKLAIAEGFPPGGSTANTWPHFLHWRMSGKLTNPHLGHFTGN